MKMSIYQQLKAQNKLEHFELHLAALIPQKDERTFEDRYSGSWIVPKGGQLCYSYDWTYRGEDGYVAVAATYMAPSDVDAYISGDFGSLGELMSSATGIAVSNLANKIPMLALLGDFAPFFTAISIAGLAEDVLVRKSINDADGYGKLSAVYDSISGGTSKVLVGWDTHPTVSLDWPDAYNISFYSKS